MQIRTRGNIPVYLSSGLSVHFFFYALMSTIVHFGNVLGRRYSFVMTTKQDLDIVLPQLSLDPHSPRFTILIWRQSEQELDRDTSLLCQSVCLPLSVSTYFSVFICLSLSICLSLHLSVGLHLSFSVCLSLSLPASISF